MKKKFKLITLFTIIFCLSSFVLTACKPNQAIIPNDQNTNVNDELDEQQEVDKTEKQREYLYSLTTTSGVLMRLNINTGESERVGNNSISNAIPSTRDYLTLVYKNEELGYTIDTINGKLISVNFKTGEFKHIGARWASNTVRDFWVKMVLAEGNIAYVLGSSGNLLKVDTETGVFEQIGTKPVGDKFGWIYPTFKGMTYVSENLLYLTTINNTTVKVLPLTNEIYLHTRYGCDYGDIWSSQIVTNNTLLNFSFSYGYAIETYGINGECRRLGSESSSSVVKGAGNWVNSRLLNDKIYLMSSGGHVVSFDRSFNSFSKITAYPLSDVINQSYRAFA